MLRGFLLLLFVVAAAVIALLSLLSSASDSNGKRSLVEQAASTTHSFFPSFCFTYSFLFSLSSQCGWITHHQLNEWMTAWLNEWMVARIDGWSLYWLVNQRFTHRRSLCNAYALNRHIKFTRAFAPIKYQGRKRYT